MFKEFIPEKVLLYYDGPLSFTVRTSCGQLCYAHWHTVQGCTNRYLVVPVTEDLLDDLENGRISLLEALTQPRMWLVDIDKAGHVFVTDSSIDKISPEDLPVPGIKLLPEFS